MRPATRDQHHNANARKMNPKLLQGTKDENHYPDPPDDVDLLFGH